MRNWVPVSGKIWQETTAALTECACRRGGVFLLSAMRLIPLALLACAGLSAADDTATVYLYRLRMFQNSAWKMTLWLDGERLANLQNGRYFVVKLPPGKHVLSDKNPDNNIDLNVESGRTYYMRLEPTDVGMFGRNATVTRFSGADEATGKSDVHRLKVGDSSEIQNRKLIPPTP
jgi:Protein of unknown function (DUF2846)